MSRKPLVDTDDYQITAQLQEGLIFLHCNVYNFSKSVLKDLRDVFEVLCEEARLQGHYTMFSITPNSRFVKALRKPFDVIEEFEKDGESYEVVAWDLIQLQLAT